MTISKKAQAHWDHPGAFLQTDGSPRFVSITGALLTNFLYGNRDQCLISSLILILQ